MIIKNDFPLSQILWYKFGPKTRYLLRCNKVKDIIEAFEFIAKNSILNFRVAGSGSNIIFTGKYFDGAVIHISGNIKNRGNMKLNNDIFTVYSGISIDDLIWFSFDNKFTGLEWAGGLPGTIGGALRGNAGAFGREIKDHIVSADILEWIDGNYAIKTFSKEDLDFSYRNSIIKQNKNLTVLSVNIKLHKAGGHELREAKNAYENNINYRKAHHPVEYPNCGSVFKNIADAERINKILKSWPDMEKLVKSKWHGKVPMGYVINRLGLTGYQSGDMQVSRKHSNFIINRGNGKAGEVLNIIKTIQKKTLEALGFIPETEVEII